MPHAGHGQILLQRQHLVYELLLQVDIFLLYISEGARIIDFIRVDSPYILSNDFRVIGSIVLDILILQCLDQAL